MQSIIYTDKKANWTKPIEFVHTLTGDPEWWFIVVYMWPRKKDIIICAAFCVCCFFFRMPPHKLCLFFVQFFNTSICTMHNHIKRYKIWENTNLVLRRMRYPIYLNTSIECWVRDAKQTDKIIHLFSVRCTDYYGSFYPWTFKVYVFFFIALYGVFQWLFHLCMNLKLLNKFPLFHI